MRLLALQGTHLCVDGDRYSSDRASDAHLSNPFKSPQHLDTLSGAKQEYVLSKYRRTRA